MVQSKGRLYALLQAAWSLAVRQSDGLRQAVQGPHAQAACELHVPLRSRLVQVVTVLQGDNRVHDGIQSVDLCQARLEEFYAGNVPCMDGARQGRRIHRGDFGLPASSLATGSVG